MEKDQIIKFLAYDGKISVICASTTNMVEEARKIHDLSPVVTAALGRVITITALIGAEMKNKTDKLTIQIKGNGPVGKIVAVAASEGNSEYLKKILIEDFKRMERNVWGEFSSKAATFALRCGALPIPIEAAETIMDPKKFYDKKEDGYFYTRDIKGHKHTKIMMGNHLFYNHNVDEKLTEEDIQKFKKLAIKYAAEDEKLNHI